MGQTIKISATYKLPLAMFILVVFTTAADLPATLPVDIQAVLFSKILHYNKKVQKPGGDFKVLIVKDSGAENIDNISVAFQKVGLLVVSSDQSQVASKLAGIDAIYIPAGVAAAPIKKISTENGILTISAVGANAEAGEVSMALGLKDDGRPQIIINLSQLKAENQEFSSDLLALAKVIK